MENKILEKILELTKATPSGSFGGFGGHCLSHSDSNKSLSITQKGDGKILLKCHAGCSQDDIIETLKSYDAWPSSKLIVDNKKLDLVNNLWNGASEINDNDPVGKYLKSRGLTLPSYPNSLRFSSNCYNTELEKNEFALICKIINSNDELVGLQRIYIDRDGNKLKVESPKMILGSCIGGYVELKGDLPSNIIHIAEGIETGLAIWLSLNETVWCAVSANNLSKIPTAKTTKTIQIWADKDKSGTGQREAVKAATEFSSNGLKVFLHLPKNDIPEGSKGIDFLDVYVKNPDEIIEEKKAGQLFHNEILPIKMPNYDLPKLNDLYLPCILRDWVFSQAERLNVAPEVIAVPLFSIIGSLLGVKLAIRPKKKDLWTVFANLWAMIIAPPGTKKSAVLNTSVKILNKFEQEENKKSLEQVSEHADEIMEIEIKVSNVKKKLKDAITNDEHELKTICRKELSELLKREKELKVPVKRFSTSAFSLEKLIDMLGENLNGLLIVRDELSGLFESFKKKGQETTRQFLLEGWNGDGSFNYDILSRPTKPLSGICLTILGGTQPSVINKMLSEMRIDQNNDGFIQRFQLIAYPNQDLKPGFIDKEINLDLEKKVFELLDLVCNLENTQHGIKTSDSDTCYAKLNDDSYKLFANYLDSIEKEVHLAENDGYKNHINKFPKLLSGLILIFHVIDNFETKRTNHYALPHVVEMAIIWTDLFKAHAKKLYDTEFNFESLSGFALAKKISEGKVKDGTSLRTLYHNGWTNLKSIQEVESAARFLEKHNWLKAVEDKPNTGRPSIIIKFNTSLLEFVSKEKWYE